MPIKFFSPASPPKFFFNSSQMLLMTTVFFSTFSSVLAEESDNDSSKLMANVIHDTIPCILFLSLTIAFFRILTLLSGRPYASLQGVPIYADSEEAKREGGPPPLTCGGDEELYNTLRNSSPTFLQLLSFGLNERVCLFSVITPFIYEMLAGPSHEDLSYREVAECAVSNVIIGSTIFLASVSFFRSCCTTNGQIRATNEGYEERYHSPIYGSIP